ncbi:SDR family oxidoreductase [Oceanicella sp. SM1341]|uniref:SDR family oxidoreductase n=1 Tax=Oceanicella sp. SM1341 TaxID=1548889 RepID=UPI000E49C359|nr:SDR family oxidoreductase [Oceanicella sp. SM1341]
MQVFVTGASGFVGSAVVAELVGAGHAVTGLVRSEAAAAALRAAGGAPLHGELADTAGLARAAAAAEAVVHTAFVHDFDNFAASVALDREVIGAMGGALEGSGKPFLVTSGIGLLQSGDGPGTEETPAARTGHAALRGANEELVHGLAARGVRAGVLRLPPSVHGAGDHGFVPCLVALARRSGVSAWIGEGTNRWSAVHRADAARLYRAALERGEPGQNHHAVGETGLPFREIAEAIGRGLGLPTVSVPEAEAGAHFGWIAAFVAREMAATARLTAQRLGWGAEGPGLLEDMAASGYFDA